AGVVESFEETAADIVASCGGWVVKALGDEVLYVADSAAEAADIALRLASGIRTHVEVPDVRVGVASGPVLTMHGDVFGTTVNRSSRLTSFARPGTVLIDDTLAGELEGTEGLQVVQVRARHAHGLGLIQPYALRRNYAPGGAPEPERSPAKTPISYPALTSYRWLAGGSGTRSSHDVSDRTTLSHGDRVDTASTGQRLR